MQVCDWVTHSFFILLVLVVQWVYAHKVTGSNPVAGSHAFTVGLLTQNFPLGLMKINLIPDWSMDWSVC